jgi:hypothetical protein
MRVLPRRGARDFGKLHLIAEALEGLYWADKVLK